MEEARFYRNLEDWIRSIAPSDKLLERARSVLLQTLMVTGHLPSIYAVSRGAGYCSYYARLVEAIGASRGYLVNVLSGKGSDVHRVVGLTVLRIFRDRLLRPDFNSLQRYVENAVEDLDRERILRSGRNGGGVINVSLELLQQLFNRVLPRACRALGVRLEDLFPIVEQQFIDYDLHMKGSPDLILEDRAQRKAIVIEWKTEQRPSTHFEKAQVLAYSLIEAKRLGYGPEAADLEKAILGELEPRDNSVRGFKILPIIVRPIRRGELEPHPALAPFNKVRKKYEEILKLLRNVLIEAEHLTVLLTNQRRLTGIEPDQLLVPLPRNPGIKVNVLRLTPEQLPRGKPSSRNTYPCVSKKHTPICDLMSACRFYFARRVGEREKYEKILWGLRFEVFDEKEKDLLVYKALHIVFKHYDKDDVLEKLKQGKGVVIDLERQVARFEDNYSINQRKKVARGRIVVIRTIYEPPGGRTTKSHEKRVDVLDEVVFQNDVLVSYRKLRDYEDNELLHVVDEGKPVLITPIEADNPLLSIGMFGRVDDVDLVGDGDRVRYIISVPSKLLNYQRLLFAEYLKMREEFRRDLLVVEVDVDLTRMELNALDALQRLLKEGDIIERISMETDEEVNVEELRRQLQSEAKDLESVIDDMLGSQDPDQRSLSELLRKVVGGRR